MAPVDSLATVSSGLLLGESSGIVKLNAAVAVHIALA